MGPKLHELVDAKVILQNTSGGADSLATTVPCDGTGFSRARFIFTLGDGVATTAQFGSNIGVWESANSGGTYTSRSGAVIGTTITSGVLSSACINVVIDIPLSEAKPWLKISGGSNLSTGVAHSCIVELYDSWTAPFTDSVTRIVTI